MNWFGDGFRKAHIIYVSPDWAAQRGEKFDAKVWTDMFQEARIEALELYAKDHHGICYYQSTIGLPYPRDILGELLEQTRHAGIKLMAYFSVGYDTYAFGVHPDWLTMSPDGRPFQYRPFYHGCLNTPYREYALAQIEEIVRQYPVDGLWLDIVSFAFKTPEHTRRHLLAPCYCIWCRRKYRDHFGRPVPVRPTPSEAREAWRWELANVSSFLEETYRIARSYRPGMVIAYNGAGNPADPMNSADIVSIESHGPDYFGQSLTARWSRSRGKPFETLTPSAPSGWCTWDEKPPNMLAVETGVIVAQGGSPVLSIVPYLDGSIDPAHIEGLGKVFRRIETLEPHLRDTTSVAQIAILLGTKPADAPHLWTAASLGARSWLAALTMGHFLFDVVPSVADATRYQLIVVPDSIPLSDEDSRQLADYVAGGGKLLLHARSALLDGDGQLRDAFALQEVLGVRFEHHSEHVFCYLRTTDPRINREIPDIPLLVQRQAAETSADSGGGSAAAVFDRGPRGSQSLEVALTSAETLVTLHLPETAYSDATTYLWGAPPPKIALPGITANRYGKGVAAYIALPLEARGYENVLLRQLAINLVEHLLGPRWVTTDAASGLELVINRQGDRYVLHLIDHRAGDPSYGLPGSGRTAAGIGVSVDVKQLPVSAATVVPTGEAVTVERADGRVSFTLPAFESHLVLELSP